MSKLKVSANAFGRVAENRSKLEACTRYSRIITTSILLTSTYTYYFYPGIIKSRLKYVVCLYGWGSISGVVWENKINPSHSTIVMISFLSGSQMVMAYLSQEAERTSSLAKLGFSYGIGMVVGPSLGGFVTKAYGEQASALVAAAGSFLR